MEVLKTRFGGDPADLVNNATRGQYGSIGWFEIQRPGETIQEFGIRMSKLLHEVRELPR